MIIFDGPVAPEGLTVFVREVPTPSDFALSRLFPTEYTYSNEIDFAEVLRTNRTARYRSFDGRIHVSSRDGGSSKRIKLPALSTSYNMGELERLQLQFAETGGTRTEPLVRSIYNDAANGTQEVLARIEQSYGDLLVDGKLTIDDDGFKGESDYGVPAGNLVAPAVLWTHKTGAVYDSPILTDLTNWCDAYAALNGFRPGYMLTSLRAQRLMQVNAEIIAAVAGTQTGRTRVRLTELNDLLSSEGLPTLLPTYDTVVDVDGTSTRTVPDDRVAFLPPNPADLMAMKFGISATALELVNSNVADFSFEESPGIVGVVTKAGPPYREFVFIDAVGMPYIKQARYLMTADVA